jgi:hypothetical protein
VAGSVKLPEAGSFEPVKINGWTNPVDIPLPDFHLNGYGWLICHRTIPK